MDYIKVGARAGVAGLLVLQCAKAFAGDASLLTLQMGCDWIQGPSVESKNSGFIDSNADYQIAALPVSLPEGDEILIRGHYPLTRYFSFQVYDGNRAGNLLDSLPDARMRSVDGMGAQMNRAAMPYLPSRGRQYELHVRFEDAPLRAADRQPNTLYAGQGTDKAALAKQLVYRRYLADIGVDALGRNDLPQLLYRHANGHVTPLAETPDARHCGLLQGFYRSIRSVPGVGIGVGKPDFKPITSEGLYPNGDSAYLRAAIGSQYADLTLVRVRIPQYARVRRTDDAAAQVRYWSLCQYGLYSTKVIDCKADRQSAVDAQGYATFVISPPAKRPALATPSRGYTWVNFGAEDNALTVLRETLAAPGFVGDYRRVVDAARERGAEPEAQALLGDWAPQISYCDRDVFDAYAPSGGAVAFDACVASAARRRDR